MNFPRCCLVTPGGSKGIISRIYGSGALLTGGVVSTIADPCSSPVELSTTCSKTVVKAWYRQGNKQALLVHILGLIIKASYPKSILKETGIMAQTARIRIPLVTVDSDVSQGFGNIETADDIVNTRS